jgi:hypothetical protein
MATRPLQAIRVLREEPTVHPGGGRTEYFTTGISGHTRSPDSITSDAIHTGALGFVTETGGTHLGRVGIIVNPTQRAVLFKGFNPVGLTGTPGTRHFAHTGAPSAIEERVFEILVNDGLGDFQANHEGQMTKPRQEYLRRLGIDPATQHHAEWKRPVTVSEYLGLIRAYRARHTPVQQPNP